MKVDAQADADLRKLGELLEGIEVAMLTTHAADGSMVSRPLQTLALEGNGDLVFFTAADSTKLDALLANPDVNLAYAHPARHPPARRTSWPPAPGSRSLRAPLTGCHQPSAPRDPLRRPHAHPARHAPARRSQA